MFTHKINEIKCPTKIYDFTVFLLHPSQGLMRIFLLHPSQELHHEIQHLVDFSTHQKQHCDTCRLWTHHYGQYVAHDLHMLKICAMGPTRGQCEAVETEMIQHNAQLEANEKQVHVYISEVSGSARKLYRG